MAGGHISGWGLLRWAARLLAGLGCNPHTPPCWACRALTEASARTCCARAAFLLLLVSSVWASLPPPSLPCVPMRCSCAGDYPLPEPASGLGLGDTLAQLSDLAQATVYQSATVAEVGGWCAQPRECGGLGWHRGAAPRVQSPWGRGFLVVARRPTAECRALWASARQSPNLPATCSPAERHAAVDHGMP